MGQGQDPYGESGEFTPYQPDATPEGEQPGRFAPPEAPFVPYGSAHPGTSITPYLASTPDRRPWVGWLIGFGVLLTVCGGGIGGIVGIVDSVSDGSDSSTGTDVEVPEIEIPTFTFPSIDIPSVDVPSMGTVILANDLQAGQCLNGAGFDPSSNDGISNLEVVDCGPAHNAQVLEVQVLSEREAQAYDFSDNSQGSTTCNALFSPAQKALFRTDTYHLLAFTETTTPVRGDKVACLVVRGDGARIRGFLPR